MKILDTTVKTILITLLLVFIFSLFQSVTLTGYAVQEEMSLSKATDFFLHDVIPRFKEIVSAPFVQKEMFWSVIPLVIIIFFMQLYFGRWKNEKLGWNSVFANFISMMFIAVGLLNYISKNYILEEILFFGTPFYKALLVGILILQVLFMMVFTFMHAIPKKISFFVGSPLTIYTLGFVIIVLVYSTIPLDTTTLITFLLLYAVVQLFFLMIRSIIPPSKEAKKYLQRVQIKEDKKRANKKRIRTRKVHEWEYKLAQLKERVKFW